MKLRLPSLLRATLLACLSIPATLYADSYLADGINANNPISSERFYDSMKGFYWLWGDYYEYGDTVRNLYSSTGGYQFLGELYQYIPVEYRHLEPEGNMDEVFATLVSQDMNLCWAYAASNALQYWQSYYGVFAGQTQSLAYGYNYDKGYVQGLMGIQSLKLNRLFFENWVNAGGWGEVAFSWYLSGDVPSYAADRIKDNHDAGGYFSAYFKNQTAGKFTWVYSDDSLVEITNKLANGLGCELNVQGKYEQVTPGQLVVLNLQSLDADGGGHGVTCYGFTTDAKGNLETLQVTDSDDLQFGLVTFYVQKEDDGRVALYFDKACTKQWGFYLYGISNISTPDSLRTMYAEYSDTSKPLYWNGKTTQWGGTVTASVSEALPTAATGWVAEAGTGTSYAGSYAIYYDASRPVMFDDRAAAGNMTVRLTGNVSNPSMGIDNSAGAYSFTGGGNTLKANYLTKAGAELAGFREVQMNIRQVYVTGGWLELLEGSTLTGNTVNAISEGGNTAGIRFNGGTATLSGALTLGSGAVLDISTPTSLTVSTLDFQSHSTFSLQVDGTTPDAAVLTLTGGLLLDPAASLSIHFSSDIGAERTFTLASVSGNISLSASTDCYLSADGFDTSSYSAELQLSADGSSLQMVLAQVSSLYWKGGDGNWNRTESNWTATADGSGTPISWTDGAYVHFSDTTAAVNVEHAVNSYALMFSNGSYSFSGGGNVSVERRIILADQAQVVMDAAPVLGNGVAMDIESGSSLKVNAGDMTLRSLHNEGTLTLAGGSLSMTGAVEQGGSVAVAGTLSLAAFTQNAFRDVQADTLTLASGSSVAVEAALGVKTISLASLAEVPAVTAGSLSSSSLDFLLTQAAQRELSSMGLMSSDSVAILQAGNVAPGLGLSVGGADSITIGSYDYFIGTEADAVILTAYRTGMSRWVSTNGQWQWTGDAPAPGVNIGFLGQGTETVQVNAAHSVADILVEAGNGKAYTTSGQGTLSGLSLAVTAGSMDLGHSATSIEGEVVIGAKGALSVQKGSRLEAGSMSLKADNSFANAGTTVVAGALSATGVEFSNSGLLSVGSGTQIGSLAGAGELVVTGDAEIVNVPELRELHVADGATLSVNNSLSVTGNYTGSGYLKSASGVTLKNVSSQRGSISAQVVTLAGVGNRLGELETAVLELAGELDASTPMLTLDTIKAVPAGVSAFLRQSGNQNSLVISLNDTDAAYGSYDLINAAQGVADGSVAFTLLPETELAFQRNRAEATLETNGDTLVLNLVFSQKSVYEEVCQTANGTQGARLLGNLFYEQGSLGLEEGSALAQLLKAADASLLAGDYQGLDRLSSASGGSSIPVLGLAFAGEMESRLRAVRNRTTTMGVDSRYEHPDMPYVNAWINAEGGYRKFENDGSAAGYELTNWGGTVGLDVDVTEQLTFGFACSALYGDLTATGSEDAEGDMDTYYASFFARVPQRNWVHTFVLTAGVADMSLERTVRHAAGSYTAEGETSGVAVGALYELAYTISLTEDEDVCWQPLFNASYVHVGVDSYTEDGCDAALVAGEQKLDCFTLGLGGRLQAIVGENIYNRTSMLELRAMVTAELGDRKGKADTSLALLPGVTANMESHEREIFGIELGAGLVIPISADSGELFFDVSSELQAENYEVSGAAGWRVHF